jgi:hypothetical protein
MKKVYVVFETDQWHSTASITMIGVFTTKAKMVKGLKQRYNDLSLDDLYNLNTIKQTQGRKDNILVEEWIIDKILNE